MSQRNSDAEEHTHRLVGIDLDRADTDESFEAGETLAPTDYERVVYAYNLEKLDEAERQVEAVEGEDPAVTRAKQQGETGPTARSAGGSDRPVPEAATANEDARRAAVDSSGGSTPAEAQKAVPGVSGGSIDTDAATAQNARDLAQRVRDGDYDGHLSALTDAEREGDDRSTVLAALEARSSAVGDGDGNGDGDDG